MHCRYYMQVKVPCLQREKFMLVLGPRERNRSLREREREREREMTEVFWHYHLLLCLLVLKNTRTKGNLSYFF